MTLRKYAVGVALAVALLGGAFFLFERSRTRQVHATPVPQAPAAPKERTFQGHVEALHTVAVPVSIDGEVDSFSAEVGQDVFEGQVLARISNQGLETGLENAQRILQAAETRLNTLETSISAARLEAVRARDAALSAASDLEHASKEFERQRMLNDAGATPRNTFQKSEREYEAAKAKAEGTSELARHADAHIDELSKEYDLAKKTLEDKRKESEEAQSAMNAAEIRAPVDGVIVARQGEIGQPLTAEQASALFNIANDLSALRVAFTPDSGMKPGDRISIVFTDVPVEPIAATVGAIQNGQATADFTSPNAAIRPGMSCTVHATIK